MLVLGSQKLTELRDSICCVSDLQIGGEFSNAPDQAPEHISKVRWPSLSPLKRRNSSKGTRSDCSSRVLSVEWVFSLSLLCTEASSLRLLSIEPFRGSIVYIFSLLTITTVLWHCPLTSDLWHSDRSFPLSNSHSEVALQLPYSFICWS